MDKEAIRIKHRFFRRFIPKYIKNKTVLRVYELMRKIQRISGRSFSVANSRVNEEAYRVHEQLINTKKFYIENQSHYVDMFYGKTTVSYSGCEVIAVFNALRSIDVKRIIPLPKLISDFERDGMVRWGRFGTSPLALRDFLKRQGLETYVTTDEKEFDAAAENSEALILTIYNDKNDIMKQIHTVCISKSERGYTIHNLYGNGAVFGGYPRISDLVHDINFGKAKAICLISISPYKYR